MTESTRGKAQFTRIDQSRRADWEIISGDQPYQVTRLEHRLQTATRALRDEAEGELVVAALLHDSGDELAPFNQAEFAVAMIKPFLSGGPA